MTYNLNTIPSHNGKPYGIDYTIAQYIAEALEARVSTDNPMLEFRIAQELRNDGTVELNQQELDYLLPIIVALPIDNLFKGQILQIFKPNETDHE